MDKPIKVSEQAIALWRTQKQINAIKLVRDENMSSLKGAMDALRALDGPPLAHSPDVTKLMAMEIGKETVAYVEYMYPEAIKAASSTFKLSLRNTIYNEIMSMLKMTDEREILERIDRQKSARRKTKSFWDRHRATDWEKVRAARDAEIVPADIEVSDD